MKRARLGAGISAAKAKGGGGPVMRPEREARVLRRLLRRNKGKLDPEVVARIWRELFPAMVRLQGSLRVVVCGGPDPVGMWDLARSQFGSATTLSLVKTPGQALGAVARDRGRRGSLVAVLPVPGARGGGLWWRKIAIDREGTPRIIGKLPFLKGTAAIEAVVVGCLDWRPSGDDQTLIAVMAAAKVTRKRLLGWMKSAGLPAQIEAGGPADSGERRRLHLVRVSDYVGPADPRLDGVRSRAGGDVTKIVVVGGYPTCFDAKAGR